MERSEKEPKGEGKKRELSQAEGVERGGGLIHRPIAIGI